jgi:hypothetical protein
MMKTRSRFLTAALLLLFLILSGCSGVKSQMQPVRIENSGANPSLRQQPPIEDEHHLLAPEGPEFGRVAVWPFSFTDRKSIATGKMTSSWVIEVFGSTETEGPAGLATQAVVETLVNNPIQNIEVVEREQILPLIAEMPGDASGMTTTAELVKAGRLLGANHIVVGACLLGTKDGDLSLAMRLIETKGAGRIVAAQTAACERCGTEEWRILAKQLAAKLLLPKSPFDDAGWADDILPGTKD